MNGLKLVVADGDADQFGHENEFVVPEGFQIPHEMRDRLVVGRDEYRIHQSGSADPVLAAAKFARRLALTALNEFKNCHSFTWPPHGAKRPGMRWQRGKGNLASTTPLSPKPPTTSPHQTPLNGPCPPDSRSYLTPTCILPKSHLLHLAAIHEPSILRS